MRADKTDQQVFDEHVNATGKLVLQVLAGIGVFAAVIMSIVAVLISSDNRAATAGNPAAAVPAAPAHAAAPAKASVRIDHVTRGCHTLAVNGGLSGSPTATLRLSAGGELLVQNNDVMPHRLVVPHGATLRVVTPMMGHMGARSSVTFPARGTYRLATKAGEDYTKGVVTKGADNTLSIKVVVT